MTALHSRRRLLEGGLAAGVAATVALLLEACDPQTAGNQLVAADAAAYHALYLVEQLNISFCAGAFQANRLTPENRARLDSMDKQCRAHAAAIAARLTRLHDTPPAQARFQAPAGTYDSGDSILRFGVDLKLISVQSSLGMLNLLSSAALRRETAGIGFVHGQQRVRIRALAGINPVVDTPFEPSMNLQQVRDTLKIYGA
jgi:hypothetical protein